MLLVDDDPQVREVVRVNLEMEGYAVREAANAEDGLAALEDEAPDLILLDVMMPQVDGWEMLRRVQERHGVGSIPVVMFSGQLDAGSEAAQRGAQGFVGQAVRPARADRPDEANRSGLISASARAVTVGAAERQGRRLRPGGAGLSRRRS